MILNYDDFINEISESNIDKLTEVKNELTNLYTDNSLFKGLDIDKRISQLFTMHKTWLNIVLDSSSYTPYNIASILYHYDYNLQKR